MELNEYQERAMSTRMDSCDNLSYMLIGLQGEVGELSSKVAKLIRKDKMRIEGNDYVFTDKVDTSEVEESKKAILDEIGDCLWFVAGVSASFGVRLQDVANANLEKLASRKKRGVIDGEGDKR